MIDMIETYEEVETSIKKVFLIAFPDKILLLRLQYLQAPDL